MSRSFLNTNSSSQNEKHDVILKKSIEDIHLNSSGVSYHEDNNTKLTSIDGKITSIDTKLPSALTGSGNLKVCIQELGNEGSERLNVDIGDDITQLPTALTGAGNFKVSIQENLSKRSVESVIALNSVIAASAQIGGNIDISTKKSILIYGSATGNHSFYLEHSMDNSNFFLHSEIIPVTHGATFHYNVKIEDGLKFYRLINSASGNTFSLNYVTL